MRQVVWVCVYARARACTRPWAQGCVRGQLFSSAACSPAPDCSSLQNRRPPGLSTLRAKLEEFLYWDTLLESVQLSRPWGAEKGSRGYPGRPPPQAGQHSRTARLRFQAPGYLREDCPRATAAAPGPRWAGGRCVPPPPQPRSPGGARRPRFTLLPSGRPGPQAPLPSSRPRACWDSGRRSSRPPSPRTMAATKARGPPSRPTGGRRASLPPYSALSRPLKGKPRGNWGPRAVASTGVGTVPGVRPATEHLRYRLPPSAAPETPPLQAATGRSRPTSACSRRAVRPRSKGAGLSSGVRPVHGVLSHRGPPTPGVGGRRGESGQEASRPHMAAPGRPSGPLFGPKPGVERGQRGNRPHGSRRPRVNYLSCSWCLKRFCSF